MRPILLGAALGALLTILVTAPAAAVPANEILIAKNLQRLGIVPSYATPGTARAAARALAAKGAEYPVKPAAGKAPPGKALGRYLSAHVVSGRAAGAHEAAALVLLIEFGDGPWPHGDPSGHDLSGPSHGQIPPPAADDNATFWPGDFGPMHYQQMLFGNSYPIYGGYVRGDGGNAAGNPAPWLMLRGSSDETMRNYYLEQSHGAYTVRGEIKDWVALELPESYYGADNDPWNSTDNLTGPVWRVARDAIVKFAADNPGFDWSSYDQENPYGITGDDFDRPDGYLDHLILIHAGSDQSAGGGAQGSDAIWAHSWGIYENYRGGPGDGPGMMIPGTDGLGPQGLGIWAHNYTVNPEDGDVGVFCHEFAHDLGLPDEYDYSSATGDATTGFWTIMASGSWLGRQWGLGSQPAAMNVWDKSVLGFVRPKVVDRGRTATIKLRAAAEGDPNDTGVRIRLPKATHTVRLSAGDGAAEWYSTSGNDADLRLRTAHEVEVPAGGDLTFRTWYDIEEGYDHGLVQVSDDGALTWHTLKDFTGAGTNRWTDTAKVDLAAYEGKSVLIRFAYTTDGGVALRGWEVSDVAVGGEHIPASAFATGGWIRVDGGWKRKTERFYIAEYRTHDGFDESLKNCYQWNLGYTSWVDWFGYNRGLHLIYRDTFYQDNDVASHAGAGGWMVVDSHPMAGGIAYGDGAAGLVGYWRPRIQVRDASFSLKPTAARSIYFADYDRGVGVAERTAPGLPAQPRFSDAKTYWYTEAPEAGVKIPRDLGVRITVRSMSSDTMTIRVDNQK